MKRILLCGLLAAALLIGSAIPARAGVRVPVQIDGERLDAVSYMEAGITYVPMRSLLDALGGWLVHWDSAAGEAAAVSGGKSIRANPAADTIRINGKTYSGKVWVENGRTYIPLRVTATALGHSVTWDRYLSGAAVTSAGTDHSAMDLYWLSRIISAESRGESLRGQIAVGNVVLNRVKSQEFPNSVADVIFDMRHAIQFQPVENGTIFLSPTARSVEAAKRALDGESFVGASLYFYAPALSQGIWINANRVYHSTIGCHRFYL